MKHYGFVYTTTYTKAYDEAQVTYRQTIVVSVIVAESWRVIGRENSLEAKVASPQAKQAYPQSVPERDHLKI